MSFKIQIFFIIAIVIYILPSDIYCEEQITEKLSQTKIFRTQQQSTNLHSNLRYPNHQILNYYRPENQNVTNHNIVNNRQLGTSTKSSVTEFPKNHRLDGISPKPQTAPSIETKKAKFSINIDEDDEDYKPNNHLANKHKSMRTILLNLLKRSENNKNFAAVLPILKVMSPAQRVAMASLVTNQISSEGKNNGLKLAQVKSMFGNNSNVTSDLMLPIILDIAKLFKALKDYNKRKTENLPQPELLRRSFSDSDDYNIFDITQILKNNPIRSQRRMDMMDSDDEDSNIGVINNSTKNDKIVEKYTNSEDFMNDDITLLNDTITESVNSTGEDLPVAEELRYVNKFTNGHRPMVRPSLLRRPIVVASGHKPPPIRRMSSEQLRRRQALQEKQKKAALEPGTCNLFTDTLCLDVPDYPINAIMSSIRKNLNAMSALHSDFPELSADSALDGITKIQEGKYTPEHYLNNINRREDGANRHGDASGFMCPSIVKYARPQKARATSGQWKYIVNTDEHTQTLRLEKCLKPKESCTFLTDNFKSKCVQVYNYHRLLTWDQQNGLHMDIFKVPTCCSCHIDGYSFAFPPHNGKPFELTTESFPGEEIVHDIFASKSKQQSTSKDVILTAFRNGNNEEYPSQHFNFPKNSPAHPSINSNNYYEDIYQTQDTNIHVRNVKKPPRDDDSDSELSSFLEPPFKTNIPKTKTTGSVYIKRGNVGNQGSVLKRPIRKPIRKKISHDDQDVGASDNYNSQSIDIPPGNSHTKVPIIIRSPKDEPPASSVKSNSKQLSTADRQLTKIKSDKGEGHLTDLSLNRRVNYNYHPIIDFFEEANNENPEQIASDRIDASTDYSFNEESDWRPMSGPVNVPLNKIPITLHNTG